MIKMRKRWYILLLLTAVFLLTSCEAKKAQEDDPYAAYELNWEESAAQTAKETKTLRFYFMSGEGLTTSASETEGKWGDACLVAFPDGQLMLIDTALDEYAPVLVRNLKKLGVERLDYVVLSHPHDDHYGGLSAEDGLIQNFEIGKVYYGGTYNGRSSRPSYAEDIIKSHSLEHEILTQGDTLTIGDVSIDVLWPHPEDVGVTFTTVEDVNSASLVLRLQYKDISALFCGDVYNKAEWAMVKELGDQLNVDILKIPHHGNQTSSSNEFAEATSPKVAVVTGWTIVKTNIYARYATLGSRVLMDRTDGYVRVVTDGKTIDTETSRERSANDPYAMYEKAS